MMIIFETTGRHIFERYAHQNSKILLIMQNVKISGSNIYPGYHKYIISQDRSIIPLLFGTVIFNSEYQTGLITCLNIFVKIWNYTAIKPVSKPKSFDKKTKEKEIKYITASCQQSA